MNCTGRREFQDIDGRTKADQIHIVEHFPGIATQGLISRLKANMEFKCEMRFYYDMSNHQVSYNFSFTTPITGRLGTLYIIGYISCNNVYMYMYMYRGACTSIPQ